MAKADFDFDRVSHRALRGRGSVGGPGTTINIEDETMKILNAFSLNMLPLGEPLAPAITEIGRDRVREISDIEGLDSAIGHESTAAVIGADLGLPIPADRQTVQLALYERAIVVQYVGSRLPEGATELPAGTGLRYFLVHVLKPVDEAARRQAPVEYICECPRCEHKFHHRDQQSNQVRSWPPGGGNIRP